MYKTEYLWSNCDFKGMAALYSKATLKQDETCEMPTTYGHVNWFMYN